MKKLIFLTIALLSMLQVRSQFTFKHYELPIMGQESQDSVINFNHYDKHLLQVGISVGIGFMNFSLKPIDNLYRHQWIKSQAPDLPNADYYKVLTIASSTSPGLSFGVSGNLRIMKYLALRFIPTLSFGSHTLSYSIQATGMAGTPAGSDTTFLVNKKVNLTYVAFPVLLKYSFWQKGNYGAYLIGGINYTIDLAAAKKTKKDTGTGNIFLKTNDIGAQIGAGFDIYTAYFKLGIEAKMIFGLKNLIVDDNTLYSGSINQFHSRIFWLSFYFE